MCIVICSKVEIRTQFIKFTQNNVQVYVHYKTQTPNNFIFLVHMHSNFVIFCMVFAKASFNLNFRNNACIYIDVQHSFFFNIQKYVI